MLSLKPGVRVLGLTPQACLIIMIVDGVYRRHGADCVVTSCTDGKHGFGSDHYIGNSIDFRTHTLRALGLDTHEVVKEIRTALGAEFDVIFESAGTDNEHAHCEWDPK